MLARLRVAVAIVVVALAGCVSPGTAPSGAGNTSAGRGAQPSEVTPNPVHLVVKDDAGKTATASIGTGGGTVAATSSDGTHYQLVVPKGALDVSTTISLIPMAAIDGAPDGTTFAFGATFQPAGLVFRRTAWLLVTPSGKIAVSSGFDVDRGEAWLSPIGFDGTRYVAPVAHFSGTGGVGLPGSVGPAGWGSRTPSSPARTDIQNDAISHDGPYDVSPSHDWSAPDGGLGPPGGSGGGSSGGMGGASGGSSGSESSGRLDGSSSPSLTDGIGDPGTNGADADGSGGTSGESGIGNDLRDLSTAVGVAAVTSSAEAEAKADALRAKLVDKIKKAIDAHARACIEQRNVKEIREVLRLQSIGMALGLVEQQPEAEYQNSLIKACLRFELVVAGQFDINMADVIKMSEKVNVTVPLEWAGATFEGSADKQIDGVGYDRFMEMMELFGQGLGQMMGIDVPNDPTKNDYIHCPATMGQGRFGATVTNLLSDAGPKVVFQPSKVKDAEVNCPDPYGTIPVPPWLTDVEGMAEIGLKEAQPNVGLVITKWHVTGAAAPFATATAAKSGSQDEATVTYHWDLTINHVPGPMPTRTGS